MTAQCPQFADSNNTILIRIKERQQLTAERGKVDNRSYLGCAAAKGKVEVYDRSGCFNRKDIDTNETNLLCGCFQTEILGLGTIGRSEDGERDAGIVNR